MDSCIRKFPPIVKPPVTLCLHFQVPPIVKPPVYPTSRDTPSCDSPSYHSSSETTKPPKGKPCPPPPITQGYMPY
ncbi:hypothetical protein NC652_015220 [Populus alba x Populus x berolinensis]|nr:hypothetical protein NC652_015220 [Populus alba x Populus x berolinensis]